MFAKVLEYKYVDMELCSVSRNGGRVVVRAVLLRTNQATPATGHCNQWLDTAGHSSAAHCFISDTSTVNWCMIYLGRIW